MLTGAFLYLPLVFMPEADSLKHPLQFYLTILFPQIVLPPATNRIHHQRHRHCDPYRCECLRPGHRKTSSALISPFRFR